MKPFTALVTPRLRLVPVTDETVRAAARGKAALERAIGATIPEGWRGEYVFERGRRSAVRDRPRHALVVRSADNVLVGEVRFEPLPQTTRFEEDWEIGYAIAAPFRRQGYASEATGAVLDWLEGEGVERIVAGCHMKNVASVRTLRKLGFELDGSSARQSAFWWVRRADARER
jgi:RimJ/RimL family protein N-acetyltransferase